MDTTTTTVKGQVTIPSRLRKKLHIRQGTRIAVHERDGKIIMEPLPDDLLATGRGLLRGGQGGETLSCLLADRKTEAEK